jgi:hypothetical protein
MCVFFLLLFYSFIFSFIFIYYYTYIFYHRAYILLFYYHSLSFHSLADDTRAQMEADRNLGSIEAKAMMVGASANFNQFPYIPLTRTHYSHALVAALSQLISWQVFEGQSLLKDLLD